MASRFAQYVLRTLDLDAARGFYAALLGDDLWGESFRVEALPERARARGARPHWLGHLAVDDVADVARRFAAAGAEPLGAPTVLRDPFGAIVALCARGQAPGDRVAWHLLHVRDEAPAFALYASLFGWTPTEALDLGASLGRHQMFAWDDSGRAVGSVANTARQAQIHTQWMYFFRVADLDAARATVRDRGGLTLDPVRMSNGALVVACDDPQGAAFGLYQPPA